MALRLDTRDTGFKVAFETLLRSRSEDAPDVGGVVSAILSEVKSRGDQALLEFTAQFDRLNISVEEIRISAEEIEAACALVDEDVRSALEFAHGRIKAYQEKQRPADQLYVDDIGVRLGSRWVAVESAGIYVPGGLAAYPSSVLMNAVPANVAGVERIAMCVPAPDGVLNPAVLLAARIAGVSEIYRVGGAQAIAALAFGTDTIAPVDKITGPGNAYVATAKKQVFGIVGIDMIAGPSEVLVIADSSANPVWVAADLIAQAEHGMGAQSVAIVSSPDLADDIESEVDRQLKVLGSSTASEGWGRHGAIIVTTGLDEAFELSNRMAPEHLELAMDDAEAQLPRIRNAGAVFLGHHTPEAVGDYVAGTNHVLPTGRSARYSSGLSVFDFLKRISVLGCSPDSLGHLSDATIGLANAEGLVGHGRSVSVRRNR